MSSLRSWIKHTLVSTVEGAIPRSLRDRLIRHYSIPDVGWSLRNARDNGFLPETIVDVGAYVGEWLRTAHRIFPSAEILAVEAQREKEDELSDLSEKHERVQYEIALLGEEARQHVPFRRDGTGSKVMRQVDPQNPALERREMTTLDALTDGTSFAAPDLLKLDVQTYELEVLRGATRMLDRHPPELILMEVSLINVDKDDDSPLCADVIHFMDEWAYRLYDLCSFMRRPYDDALWQVDALFVHESSELIASSRWR
jgi:FkbM family methyltransferase